MESQTKLCVETIEHEMNMETSRHTEAVVVLEAKVKEIDDSKNKALESIDEKKAMIDAKKEELGKIWAVSSLSRLDVVCICLLLIHFLLPALEMQ